MSTPQQGLTLRNPDNGTSYVLDEYLGGGGQGEVWSAIQRQPGQLTEKVAVKFTKNLPKGTPEEARRNMWYAQAEEFGLARVFNPSEHFPSAYDFFFDKELGAFVTAMELIEGANLFNLGGAYAYTMEKQGASEGFPVAVAFTLIAQVLKGLTDTEWFQQQGQLSNFVHRDLKPDNLMLTPYGLVKIIDLGLAMHDDRHKALHTKGGVVRGTYCYLAPEQIHRQESLSFRTDLFALGAILYEWCTGRVFLGKNEGQMRLQQHEHLIVLLAFHPDNLFYAPGEHDHITPGLRAFIGKLLQPRPVERFKSVTEAYETLQAILIEEGHALLSPKELLEWVRSWGKEDELPDYFRADTEDWQKHEEKQSTLVQMNPFQAFSSPESYVSQKLEGTLQDPPSEAAGITPPQTSGYISRPPAPKQVKQAASGVEHTFEVNAFSMDTPVADEDDEEPATQAQLPGAVAASRSVRSQMDASMAQRLAPPPSVVGMEHMEQRLPPPLTTGVGAPPQVSMDDPVVAALEKTQEKASSKMLFFAGGLVLVLVAVIGVLVFVLLQEKEGTKKTRIALTDAGQGMGSLPPPRVPTRVRPLAAPDAGPTPQKTRPVVTRRPQSPRRIRRTKPYRRRHFRKRVLPRVVRQVVLGPPKLIVQVRGGSCYLSGGGGSFGQKPRYEITTLPEGTHRFRCFNRSKRIRWIFSATLKKGQVVTKAKSFRTGHLFLRSTSSYKLLMRGLGFIGRSGQRIALPEGRHSIILKKEGSPRREVFVTIRAGEVTRMSRD